MARFAAGFCRKSVVIGGLLLGSLLLIMTGIAYLPLSSHQQVHLPFVNTDNPNLLVFFGFPSCGDVCPTTLHKLATIMQQIPLAKQPQVVFINIDLASDDKMSAAYAQAFDPHFLGYLPSQQQLTQLQAEFGLNIKRFHNDIQHSGRTFLVKREQQQWWINRTYAPKDSTLNAIIADVN